MKIEADTYDELLTKLNEAKCSTCYGLGKLDDANPFDMFYNTWDCPDCRGTGLKPEKRLN